MHNVAVVACYSELIALRMADDVLFGKPVLLAKISAQFGGFPVDGGKI